MDSAVVVKHGYVCNKEGAQQSSGTLSFLLVGCFFC